MKFTHIQKKLWFGDISFSTDVNNFYIDDMPSLLMFMKEYNQIFPNKILKDSKFIRLVNGEFFNKSFIKEIWALKTKEKDKLKVTVGGYDKKGESIKILIDVDYKYGQGFISDNFEIDI